MKGLSCFRIKGYNVPVLIYELGTKDDPGGITRAYKKSIWSLNEKQVENKTPHCKRRGIKSIEIKIRGFL